MSGGEIPGPAFSDTSNRCIFDAMRLCGLMPKRLDFSRRRRACGDGRVGNILCPTAGRRWKIAFHGQHQTLTSASTMMIVVAVAESLLDKSKKKKGSPCSIIERRVPELISVLGSQPAGDVSHKPDGRLPLLSARPAVTPATLKRAATDFAAW